MAVCTHVNITKFPRIPLSVWFWCGNDWKACVRFASVTLWISVWAPGIPGACEHCCSSAGSSFCEEAAAGPTTPTPGSPSDSLSISLIASSAKDRHCQGHGKWKTLGPALLSNRWATMTSDRHQTEGQLPNRYFFTGCHNYIMSIPSNKFLIPHHS